MLQISDRLTRCCARRCVIISPLNAQPIVLTDLVHQMLEDLRAEQAGRRIDIVIGALPVCRADVALHWEATRVMPETQSDAQPASEAIARLACLFRCIF
jgi:alkanesulfonate monooxygenase SsuD/methylene tetrahydromethanopterin reductase-like flavin-dependent oxidoreductase (luciferase family)